MRDIVKGHYERDYKTDSEDSPDQTRRDVNRTIMQCIREARVHPLRILNIGSGPQLLERTLLQSYTQSRDAELLKNIFFATSDLAHIDARKLKGQKHANVSHVEADATMLPFASNSFGMVVSNMAIDLMPRSAFSEAAAALAPGGIFTFTLHHPDMMRTIVARSKYADAREFIEHGLENHMYFENADEIRTTLASYGLQVEEVREHQDQPPYTSKWWYVKGVKVEAPGPLLTAEQ